MTRCGCVTRHRRPFRACAHLPLSRVFACSPQAFGRIVSKLPVPNFAVRLFTLGFVDPAAFNDEDAGTACGADSGGDSDGDEFILSDGNGQETSLSLVSRGSPSLQRLEQWLVGQVEQLDGNQHRSYQVLNIVVHKGACVCVCVCVCVCLCDVCGECRATQPLHGLVPSGWCGADCLWLRLCRGQRSNLCVGCETSRRSAWFGS